jgi:hypothetical protein
MTALTPAQEIIDEAIELTGFNPHVVSFLYNEFEENKACPDQHFFEYLGELLGDAAFVIAASKGFSVDGCLAAYEIGYDIVNEGFAEEDLESIIDKIEIAGLPSMEDEE